MCFFLFLHNKGTQKMLGSFLSIKDKVNLAEFFYFQHFLPHLLFEKVLGSLAVMPKQWK